MPHGSHRPGTLLFAVHDGGVEFRRAVPREGGAAAGVEERIIFQNAHCRRDRVEARAAALQNRVAGIQSRLEARAVLLLARVRESVAGYGTGAPVDGNRVHAVRVPLHRVD